jgi:hypothetical protein
MCIANLGRKIDTGKLMQNNATDHAEFRRDLDKMRAEHFYKASLERSKLVIDFALLGIRSLIIVNGGALVALLTFLGHYENTAIQNDLWLAFGYWSAGLACALATIVFAYITQQTLTYSEHAGAQFIFFNVYRGMERAEKEQRREHEHYHELGGVLQIAGIQSALVSFAMFVVGCFEAMSALTQ